MRISRKLIRRAGIMTGLAVILCALLLALLPTLLKPVLNRWLPLWLSDDDQTAAFHLSHFSWTGLGIDQLRLTLSDGTLIQLDDLQLSYRPTELLRGHLRSLQLASALVSMPAPSAGKVAAAAAGNAREAARSQFNQPVSIPAFQQWLDLPAEHIRIDHFRFLHPLFSAELSADLTPALWRIHGDSQLDNQPLPWQLEFQLQQNGDWLLLVAEQQTLLLQQYGHVQQNQAVTAIHLDQRADFGALSERLPQLAALPLPLQQLTLQAELQLPNQGVLPQDAVLGAVLKAGTRAAQLPGDVHWQQGEWLLTLTKEQAGSDWQFRVDGQPQSVQLGAGWAGQPLTVRSGQQLSGQCDAALTQCHASGRLHNQLLSQSGQPLAALTLSPQLHWQRTQGLQLSLPLSADSQAALASLTGVPLHSGQLSGHLSARMDEAGQWQLSSQQGFAGRFRLTPPAGWTVADIQLQLLPDLDLHGDLNAASLRQQLLLEPLTLLVQPLSAHYQGAAGDSGELNLQQTRLSCQPEMFAAGFNAACHADVTLAKSSWLGWPLPDAHLSGPLHLNMNRVSGEQTVDGQFRVRAANDQLQMRLNLQHDLQQQRGSLQWHLNDMPLDWQRLGLGEMSALTNVELLSGSLAGQGWTDWQLTGQGFSIKPDMMLRADNLSAVYDSSIGFDGWNALIALRRPFGGDYLLDAQVSGQSLNPGIALNDILARSQTRIPADFSWAVADIYEMHTDVLGGRIHTPQIRFDSRKKINAFGIELDHIQLARIAALEPSAEVEASGTLDGVIPIVLTEEGVSVPGGALFARDPGGTIRYHNNTSQALGQSDQTVGMAMRLLQNFRYDQLQTNLQYQPDGALNLGLQFEGSNPDFFDGQRTHLNVNLDYNLLDLLESLRVTQDVISKLESKYQ